MTRRDFLPRLLALSVVPAALPALAQTDAGALAAGDPGIGRLKKSRAEWRRLLTPAQFAVLFDDDTERPFSSPLNEEKQKGSFLCAACYLPLFSSGAKFDSGTGWPSFFRPIAGRLGTQRDFKAFLPRTEYHCVRCGGHQGHIFGDGPEPTGKRFCNNGVALRFVPAGQPLPALRS